MAFVPVSADVSRLTGADPVNLGAASDGVREPELAVEVEIELPGRAAG